MLAVLKKTNEKFNFLNIRSIFFLLTIFTEFCFNEAKTPPDEQDITAKAIYQMPYLFNINSGANNIGTVVKNNHEIEKNEDGEKKLFVALNEIIDEKKIVKIGNNTILINFFFFFQEIDCC